MTAAVPVATRPEPAPAPVSPLGAGLLLAAVLLAAGLVAVSVSRALPHDLRTDSAIRADAPVPATPAPAPALVDVAPAIAFEQAGPGLPAGTLGPWEEVAGAWETAEGTARATSTGPTGALAVVAAPADATVAQVTLTVPRAGAGLVVSYAGPDRYVALVVGRSGNTVEMVAVEGDPEAPRPLVLARASLAGGPLVLALERRVGGVQAVANGLALGRRVVDDPGGPWRIGLVTGFRPRATEARFDDLTVA